MSIEEYTLPTDLDEMRRLRLRLDEAIAAAYMAMPATNGSGGASLPTFANLVAANAHAVVRTQETDCLHLPEPQGDRWVVVAAVRRPRWEDEPKADSSVGALVEEFDKRLNGGQAK